MGASITNVEHALAVAASDTVKVAKFVETSVLPVLKSAQANQATIESVTSLVSPQAPTSSELGLRSSVFLSTPSMLPGAAAGANGLNVTLDAQLVADIKAIASAVKGALPPVVAAPVK